MLQEFPIYAYIPASDVARARRFYEGKLGFRPKKEMAGGVVYEYEGETASFLASSTRYIGRASRTRSSERMSCRRTGTRASREDD